LGVAALAFSPDGSLLLTLGEDGKLCVFEWENIK
jgi:WD40 repeat protein